MLGVLVVIYDIIFIVQQDEDGQEKTLVKTLHNGVNEKQEKILVEFDLFSEESVGTLQFISWIGYWILASSDNKTLIIDEFGNSMHPLLSEFLVHLFLENGGQLIFSTHDVKLMNSEYIKPEQIWIVKKNELNNSTLSSLSEYDIDQDKMLDNVYLDGIVNGVPNLNY